MPNVIDQDAIRRLGYEPKLAAKAQAVFRPAPVNLSPEDNGLFCHEYLYQAPDAYWFELQNGRVLGRDILASPLNTFRHFTRVQGQPMRLKEIVRTHFWWNIRSPRVLPAAIWATDNWSFGYFHWILDVLPRLQLLGVEARDVPLIVPSRFKAFRFVGEVLDLFGQAYVFCNPREPVLVEKLFVTSHTSLTGNYNPEILQQVRKRIANSGESPKPGRRIFISRSRATKRTILNEGDLVPLLEGHGFEIVHMEDYGFREQVSLMRSASIIAGLHGAGLSNALFMNPDGALLEIRNGNDAMNNCFYTLAAACGHRYAYVKGRGNTDVTNVANVTVDRTELDRAIRSLIVEMK